MVIRYKLFFGLLILSLFLVNSCLTTTRNAQQYGYITNVENNGIIWEEWRVYFKTELESSQEESVCIDEDNSPLIQKARDLAKENKRVALHYHNEFFTYPGRCHNSVENSIGILNDIEVVK